MTRFLRFIVETTLAGKSDTIKAYTIAVGALGRGSEFDPQSDPIVRVEAGRLRQALTRYYAGPGRDDPVVIDLPRGTYVPSFQRRPIGGAPRPQEEVPLRHSSSGAPKNPTNKTSHNLAATNRDLAVSGHSLATTNFNLAVTNRHLAAACRRQIISLTDTVDAAQRTLLGSQSLLLPSADLDLASGAIAPAVPDVSPSAEAPALFNGEAREASKRIADQEEESQKPQAPPTKSRIHGAPFAIGRARPNGQIFRIALYAVAVLAILQTLFDIGQLLAGGANRGLFSSLWPTRDAVAAQSQAIAGEPVIYVEPVETVGDPTPDVPSPSMIRERMFDALARFDGVTVVSVSPRDGTATSLSASKFAGISAPNYRLSIAVNYFPDGTVMEAVRMIDTADGTIAWAKSYEHNNDPNPNRPRGHISREVAQTLLQQFAVIQAREASKRANADPMKDSYRCILDANAYQRSLDPSLYGPVRDCLEHATGDSHPPVGVFVKLARLYAFDYEFGGAGGPPGNRATLDRAYQMAVRAVDIKPTSAVAQFAMEQVLLVRRDFEQAKIADENALSLNPYDNAVIFGHAARLILTGQIDEGIAALRQNTNKKTAVWTGHHFLLAIGSYFKGDLTAAELETTQIADKNFAPGLMLDAIVAAKNKDRPRARHDVDLLYARYPSWRTDARANIGYFLPDHDMAEHVGDDFAAVVDDLHKHADVVGSTEPARHP